MQRVKISAYLLIQIDWQINSPKVEGKVLYLGGSLSWWNLFPEKKMNQLLQWSWVDNPIHVYSTLASKVRYSWASIERMPSRLGHRTLMESDRLPTAGTGFVHRNNKICQVSWPYHQFYSWPPPPLKSQHEGCCGKNSNFGSLWLQNYALNLNINLKSMRFQN